MKTDQETTRIIRRSRQQLSSLQIVFAAILAIGLLLVINFSGRIARGQQMEAERVRLQATLTVLEQRQIELKKERDYAASDASIEVWAHTEGKMVRDKEVLVIPIPAVTTIATFGDQFTLRDYNAPDTVNTGETLAVTFWWTADVSPAEDMEVAVLLINPNTGAIVAEMQNPPLSGTVPPSTWQTNDLQEDVQRLAVPSTLEPGVYELGVKLTSVNNGQPMAAHREADEAGIVGTFARLKSIRVLLSTPASGSERDSWELWWNLFFDGEPPF